MRQCLCVVVTVVDHTAICMVFDFTVHPVSVHLPLTRLLASLYILLDEPVEVSLFSVLWNCLCDAGWLLIMMANIVLSIACHHYYYDAFVFLCLTVCIMKSDNCNVVGRVYSRQWTDVAGCTCPSTGVAFTCRSQGSSLETCMWRQHQYKGMWARVLRSWSWDDRLAVNSLLVSVCSVQWLMN